MKKFCSLLILIGFFINLIMPIANAINEEDISIKQSTDTVITESQIPSEQMPNIENIEIEKTKEGNEEEENIEKIEENIEENEENIEENEGNIEENEGNIEENEENKKESEKKEEETVESNEEQESVQPILMSAKNNTKDLSGTYIIEAVIGNNMCLDVYGAYNDNGVNVQLFKQDKGDNKKFKFEKTSDGFYTIEAVHSGKVLDVYGAYKKNGTNVTQFEKKMKDNDNQKWDIIEVSDGIYKIVSKCNGLCLDIHGACSNDGTNVEVFEDNGGANQKFRLKNAYVKPIKTLDDGIYEVKAAIGTNMYLDVFGANDNSGERLQISKRNGNRNQKFRVEKNKNNDYYTITAYHSGQALDVYGAFKTNGTKVTQYKKNGQDNQQWIIKKDKDGKHYNVISKCNELYLDIHAANANKGTSVEVYEETGGANQKFEFVKIEENDLKAPALAEGQYKIESAKYKGKVLQVEGASAKDETRLQLADNKNVKEQVFSLKYNEDGTYIIKPTFAGRTIDVKYGNITNGAIVQEYRDIGGDNQRWKFESKESNTYYIESAYQTDYGMKVNTSTTNNYIELSKEDKQTFKLIPFDNKASGEALVFDGTYKVTTALADNMALDVIDGSGEAKKGLQLWNNLHVLNQKMTFTHLGNNIYTIHIVHSGMALEIATDGTNVIRQNNVNDGADEQQWILKDAGNGYYYIISKKYNDLYLSVNGSANGTKIEVTRKTENNNQKWKIQEMYFGVDLSEHNDVDNYTAMKESGQIEFMITRVGWFSESRDQFISDMEFDNNYRNAKSQGIKLGAYLYSYAQCDDDARREATALVNKLKSEGRVFDLPIFLDIEDPKYQGGLSVQQRTNICLIYGEILKNAGFKVGIYTFKNWVLGAIDMNQIPSDYALWIAAWGVNNGSVPKEINKYYGDHDIWQYTSNGEVVGINGRVDLNVTYKKLW